MLKGEYKQLITTIVVIFLLSSWISVLELQAQTEAVNQEEISLNYVDSEAIIISGDSDFVDLGFLGNGSESNPYVIENLNIRTESYRGISVRDTTSHFIIKDCYIDAYAIGIQIESVAAGTANIQNNTCRGIKGGTGMVLLYTSGITLTDNLCFNNYEGMYVEACHYLNYTNNRCGFNNVPFTMRYSYNAYIVNNTFDYGQYNGINAYACNNSVFSNNTLIDLGSSYYWGASAAIDISYSSNLTIAYNKITESREGIALASVMESLIMGNVIIGCQRYGIYTSLYMTGFVSTNNTYHHNFFIANAYEYTYWYSAESQAYDDGKNSTWYDVNTNIGNYWSNYTGSGTYPIDGDYSFYDPYPILVEDSDEDGIDDIVEEYVTFTDIYLNDTDGDGIIDGDEYYIFLTDPLNIDSDFDNITDYNECYVYLTNPLLRDTDGDLLTDGEEIFIYFTSPRNPDTDHDAIPDGWEALNGINPLLDDHEEDPDDDGLINLYEYQERSSPLNPDSDEDLLNDGLEVLVCQSSPINNDTDEDGVIDGVEYHTYGCDPTDRDTDGDHLDDGAEILIYFTSPTKVDTDGDLCGDGWEIKYKFNPLDSSDGVLDPDQDGLSNTDEYVHGTSPKNWDSDEDGFSDGLEIRKGTDPLLITDHPMSQSEVVKLSIGISLGAGAIIGLVLYVLVKKKIISFKK